MPRNSTVSQQVPRWLHGSLKWLSLSLSLSVQTLFLRAFPILPHTLLYLSQANHQLLPHSWHYNFPVHMKTVIESTVRTAANCHPPPPSRISPGAAVPYSDLTNHAVGQKWTPVRWLQNLGLVWAKSQKSLQCSISKNCWLSNYTYLSWGLL